MSKTVGTSKQTLEMQAQRRAIEKELAARRRSRKLRARRTKR